MTLLVEIAMVALAAFAVAVCVARLPDVRTTPRRRATPPAPPQPAQLRAAEGVVVSAATSAIQAHAYLRPLLVEIALARLAARGRTLERLPDGAARELLGDRLWDIVRPGRPLPADRHGPGVRPEELDAMLEVLEGL